MLHFAVVSCMETRFKVILKEQSSAGTYTYVCVCVCVFCMCASARFTPQHTPPGPVAHLTSQVWNTQKARWGETLRSSGAEIMLRCLFAWFSCAATRRRPSEPQLVFFCYFCCPVSLMSGKKGFVRLLCTPRTKANADNAKHECIFKLPLQRNPVICYLLDARVRRMC